jgi:hypothetical protein
MVRNGRKTGAFELFFYTIMFAMYAFAMYIDQIIFQEKRFAKVGLNLHGTFGGRWKFLTFIDLNLQFVYFTLCFVNALYEFFFKTNSQPGLMRRLANRIYIHAALPCGTLVVVFFWGIFAVDRDLIYPKKIEEIVPHYQNHLIHTLPLISGILDTFVTRHKYTPSWFKGAIPTMLLALAYAVWIFVIAHYGGFWVYPVLKALSTVWRGVFIAAGLLFAAIVYKGGNVLNSLYWQTSTTPSPAKAKKHN